MVSVCFCFQDRSQTLATYALCGFSSLSTLAVAVGIWTVVCPQRVKEMANQMLRVLVNANVACFMTACIAGRYFTDKYVAWCVFDQVVKKFEICLVFQKEIKKH